MAKGILEEMKQFRRCRFGSLILVLVSLVIPAFAFARGNGEAINNDIDFSELDRLMPVELKEKNTPAAVIEIVMGDRVVYQKASGLANVETNAPMQTDMLFRCGSTAPCSLNAHSLRNATVGSTRAARRAGK